MLVTRPITQQRHYYSMFALRLQEKDPIFADTTIFEVHFLTNLPKIQKYHFFSRTIYIIIRTDGAAVCARIAPKGRVIRRETPHNTFPTSQSRRAETKNGRVCGAKTPETGASSRKNRMKFQPGGGIVIKREPDQDKSEDNMVNKVRVTIAGAPYAIATTDPEAYITSLAKKLDEDITKLLDDNANLSVTKAAVFCAMDYLDEYRKSAGSAENMRSQIQDYIADAARAKIAEDKTNAENETLRRENAALREQLARMKAKEAAKESKEAAKAEAAGESHVEN